MNARRARRSHLQGQVALWTVWTAVLYAGVIGGNAHLVGGCAAFLVLVAGAWVARR